MELRLGYRPNSTKGKNFYRLPFTPPLSGRPNRFFFQEREDEVSRLDGELITLSISLKDQRQPLEEQGTTVVSLQQAVDGRRQALEAERKQVEGKSPFHSLFC
jgi:hypothetical protein